MPFCKNDKTRKFKGNEPSPKGLGYSASACKIGQKRRGKNGKMWKVVKVSNGSRRWMPLKQTMKKVLKNASQKGGCTSDKECLKGYYCKKLSSTSHCVENPKSWAKHDKRSRRSYDGWDPGNLGKRGSTFRQRMNDVGTLVQRGFERSFTENPKYQREQGAMFNELANEYYRPSSEMTAWMGDHVEKTWDYIKKLNNDTNWG